MKKLAIITTHPIQYNAPWFKLLSERKKIQIKVFYTWKDTTKNYFDQKFRKNLSWDIPLLEGYSYEFVKNKSSELSYKSYYNIDNPDLNRKIIEWGADAILVFGWKYKSHLKAMRYFRGRIPVYFRGDSTLLDEKNSAKDKIRRIVLKNIYKNIDYALYVGLANKNYFLAHGLNNKQLISAQHAIDNQRFMENHERLLMEASQWRKKIGIKPNDEVVLYVGKLERKKNPQILIQLAKETQSSHFSFLFVGNGELEKELKQQAAELNNIYFLDFQNQSVMPLVYRLGNLYVLPSIGPGETWGLGVNEAMACSLPIIVSDKVGCHLDLVQEAQNGSVFKAGDLNSLKSSFLRVTNNKDNFNKMGKNSLNRIKKWNFYAICEAIENSILSL